MPRLNSITRALLGATALLAATAAAQPANDSCPGAESLTVPTDGTTVSSSLGTNLDLLAAGVEGTFSCGGTAQTRSVWYAFTAPVTGSYVLSTCARTNFDSVLQVYTGTCGALTQVTSSCNDDGCGTTAGPSIVTLALTGGTQYLVQVAAYDGSVTLDASSRVGLDLNLIVAPENDRCIGGGREPQLQLNRPLLFSTNVATGNDSQVGGILDGGSTVNNCYVGPGHYTGTTGISQNAAPGRDVVFGFTPPSTSLYNIRLARQSASVNAVLYVTDSCVDAMTPPQVYAPPQCVAAANRATSSSTVGEELMCVPLTGSQPYFVWADEATTSTAGASYELEVTACNPEVEPNNTPATANALACPITAAIVDAGTSLSGNDVDFFALGTHPAGARVFAMVDAITTSTAGTSSSDYAIRVTTATDTLEYDDDNGDVEFGSLAPVVAGTPLTGVAAFLRMSWTASTTTPRLPYRLYSVVQTGQPTTEVEPNDQVVEANGSTTNYFFGTTPDGGDVDLYAFPARAGQLLFVSLDSNPHRTTDGGTSSGNHTLALLSLDGGSLVAVNDTGNTISTSQVPTANSLTATAPSGPAEGLVYRVREDGTYLARIGRTAATGQGDYLLSVSYDCSTGGGFGAPSVSDVQPRTGSISGGTTVTITGSAFNALTRVLVGGTAATITARTSGSLTIVTPPGVEGPADVVVVNPGDQRATFTGFSYFTPIAPPTITSLTPTSGPTAGGTLVTVNGTLFKPGAEVRFTVNGVDVAGTDVTIVNPAQLTVRTPAHAAGVASITVRNPADDLEGSLPGAFTFLAPPSVSSITPQAGLTSGGLQVTITGADFRDGATVRFGPNVGTNVVIDPSGTSLTVTTPAAADRGVVDVVVINPDTQQAVVPNAFTYSFPAPTITSVSPSSGYSAGGQAVTIDGTGFQLGATVTIGGAPATSVVRVSLTRLTATTPPGMAGLADVVVTNVDNQSVTATGAYRFVPPPVVTAVSPGNGPTLGGTLITLTGTGFLPGARVRISGAPAFAVTVASPTTATAITNSSTMPGPADVEFTNPDGQAFTLADGFSYDAAPTIDTVSPTVGSTAGGTVVTVRGAGFLNNATVLFGASAATSVTRVSATELSVVAPAHPVGVVSLTVRNTDGQAGELVRAFRFVAPPTLTAAAPSSGDVQGGTVVTLTGTGFTTTTEVTFGGAAADQVTFISETSLEAVAPRRATPGAVDLTVSTNGVTATLAGGFRYTRRAPTLAAVAPVSGPIAGGSLLTLSGTGFALGATVTVGGTPATDVVIVSDVLARAVAPAHAAGTVDVVLTNDDGQAGTLANAFTYVTPPTGDTGTVPGGTGSVGEDPQTNTGPKGGVSCGCSSFDASSLSLAGLGVLMVLSRRRRRS